MLRGMGIYRYKKVDCGMVLLCYNIGLYYKVYGPTVGLEKLGNLVGVGHGFPKDHYSESSLKF